MKRFIKILILSAIAIVAFSISGLAADNIRVGLHFGDSAVYSFKAKCPAGFEIGYALDSEFFGLVQAEDEKNLYAEQGGGVYLISATEYETLEEAMAAAELMRESEVYAHSGYVDGKFYVMSGLYEDEAQAQSYIENLKLITGEDFSVAYMDVKTVFVAMDNCSFVFRNEDRAFCVAGIGEATISVDGKGEYRGAIAADRTYSKAVSVVNIVAMDDYLASVVGSEMYPTWHIEALKAQAIIARTYALTRTSYKSYGIDVTDDTRTQAYKGVAQETESTYRAAHETSGLVVKYKGKLAETFFYSMSGGKTADVYSAWGGGAGLDYLASVDDIYEDVESIKGDIWSVKYTPAEIKAKLKSAGVNIGDIVAVTVSDRGDDLRVRKLTITGTDGTHTLKFDKCRSFFNLKSQYYYVSGGVSETKNTAAVLSADGISRVELGGASVLSADGVSAIGDSVCVKGANISVLLSSASESAGTDFVFDGRGNGHGVGMSQYGAWGMAKAGYLCEEIIKFYFSGVDVEQYQ